MRKVFPYVLSALVATSFSQVASAQGVSTQQAGDQNEAAQSGERNQKQKPKATRKPSTQQSGDRNETVQSGDRSAGGGSSARSSSPATPLPR